MEAVEETPGDKGVTLWAGEGEAPKTRAATPSATPPPHPPPPPGQELADFHPTFHNGLHGRLQEFASTSSSGASLTPSHTQERVFPKECYHMFEFKAIAKSALDLDALGSARALFRLRQPVDQFTHRYM